MDMMTYLYFEEAGEGGGGGAVFDSIQPFSISITNGNTSATYTLPTSVDMSKSIIVWGGSVGTLTNADDRNGMLQLTATDTVTASRVGAAGTITLYGTVVESSHLFSNVQRGTIAVTSSSSGTDTISSVTTGRTAVTYLGHTSVRTSTFATYDQGAVVALDDATTVSATLGQSSSSNTVTVSYEAIEFNDILDSLQYVLHSATSSGSTFDITISSVTEANCLVLFGGSWIAVNAANRLLSGELTSSTNFRVARVDTNSNAKAYAAWVVEIPDVFNSVENSVATYSTTDTTATDAISSVTTGNSFVSYTGTRSGVASSPPTQWSRATINSATEVLYSRGDGVSGSGNSPHSRVHEFIGS